MRNSVLRIHDILVWIRIRGSMPLTNKSGSGCGSGSFYFHHWPSRRQQKTNLKKSYSAYYFLKVHLHHFSKIKSQKEVIQQKNQGFSLYFCLMMEGSGAGPDPYLWLMDPDPGGPKTCGSGSGSATMLPKAGNLIKCEEAFTWNARHPLMALRTP